MTNRVLCIYSLVAILIFSIVGATINEQKKMTKEEEREELLNEGFFSHYEQVLQSKKKGSREYAIIQQGYNNFLKRTNESEEDYNPVVVKWRKL